MPYKATLGALDATSDKSDVSSFNAAFDLKNCVSYLALVLPLGSLEPQGNGQTESKQEGSTRVKKY